MCVLCTVQEMQSDVEWAVMLMTSLYTQVGSPVVQPVSDSLAACILHHQRSIPVRLFFCFCKMHIIIIACLDNYLLCRPDIQINSGQHDAKVLLSVPMRIKAVRRSDPPIQLTAREELR